MSPAEIAELKAEIEKLGLALDGCTDGRMREVIVARIEELEKRLASGNNPK